jgi:hypothetical protein
LNEPPNNPPPKGKKKIAYISVYRMKNLKKEKGKEKKYNE